MAYFNRRSSVSSANRNPFEIVNQPRDCNLVISKDNNSNHDSLGSTRSKQSWEENAQVCPESR